MNNSLKKRLSLLLALVLLLTGITTALAVSAADQIAIDATNFPDAKFRSIVSERFDTDGNGYLSDSERSRTAISISGVIDPETDAIESIQGIEFFTSLKTLRIGAIGLESLDVTELTQLTTLTCQGNELTSLDVSYNTKLQTLNCAENQISELDLGSNINLTTLYCYINKLKTLNLRAVPSVSLLRCDQNELTYLDVSYLTNLQEFNCSYNHIPSLDLSRSNLTEVTDYMIGNQQITLAATLDNEEIFIPFTGHGLTVSNYTGCSLDVYEDGSGFVYDGFVAMDVDELADGIEYFCGTGIDGSEDMSVQVTVTRDFYQVNFYSDDTLTSRIGKSFAQQSSAAVQPLYNVTEQCKAFDRWSGDVSNVQADMNVYPILKDDHHYVITAFDGEDIVTLTCQDCGATLQLSFKEAISTGANAANYNELLDVVPDGYINAKDFAALSKMF